MRRMDQTAMSVSRRTDGEYSASCLPPAGRAQDPHTTHTYNPFNMWTGLTSNISPRRNTIATQETISAWFWMTNSWLSTGGFLFVFFRMFPMSTRLNFRASRSGEVVGFYQILLLSVCARTLKAPSCFLQAKGQAAIEWRVTLLLVGGSTERESERERAAAHVQGKTSGALYRLLEIWSIITTTSVILDFISLFLLGVTGLHFILPQKAC